MKKPQTKPTEAKETVKEKSEKSEKVTATLTAKSPEETLTLSAAPQEEKAEAAEEAATFELGLKPAKVETVDQAEESATFKVAQPTKVSEVEDTVSTGLSAKIPEKKVEEVKKPEKKVEPKKKADEKKKPEETKAAVTLEKGESEVATEVSSAMKITQQTFAEIKSPKPEEIFDFEAEIPSSEVRTDIEIGKTEAIGGTLAVSKEKSLSIEKLTKDFAKPSDLSEKSAGEFVKPEAVEHTEGVQKQKGKDFTSATTSIKASEKVESDVTVALKPKAKKETEEEAVSESLKIKSEPEKQKPEETESVAAEFKLGQKVEKKLAEGEDISTEAAVKLKPSLMPEETTDESTALSLKIGAEKAKEVETEELSTAVTLKKQKAQKAEKVSEETVATDVKLAKTDESVASQIKSAEKSEISTVVEQPKPAETTPKPKTLDEMPIMAAASADVTEALKSKKKPAEVPAKKPKEKVEKPKKEETPQEAEAQIQLGKPKKTVETDETSEQATVKLAPKEKPKATTETVEEQLSLKLDEKKSEEKTEELSEEFTLTAKPKKKAVEGEEVSEAAKFQLGPKEAPQQPETEDVSGAITLKKKKEEEKTEGEDVSGDFTIGGGKKAEVITEEMSEALTIKRQSAVTKLFPSQVTGEVGTTATFKCQVASENVKVQWKKDGKIIKADKHFVVVETKDIRELKIAELTVKDAGKYTMVVGDEEFTSELVVQKLPSDFAKPLEPLTVLAGSVATITCETTKLNQPVTWFKDGKELKAEVGKYEMVNEKKKHHLIISNIQPGDEADYSVQTTVKAKLTTHLFVEGSKYYELNSA